MKKINVCIIGAGIGGLATGVLLTKKGYNVTIFEKESQIGGRASSLETSYFKLEDYKKLLARFHINIAFSEPSIETIFNNKMLYGYKLDLGFHILGGGGLSNIKSILSDINIDKEFLESYIGFIEEDRYYYPFLSIIDKIKIAPNILRLLLANEKTLIELDKVSISETIKKYGKGKMKLILEVFSRSITTMNDLEKISAGEMLRAQKSLYKGGKPVVYPKNGLKNIYEKFAEFIISKGGKINLNSTVEKILIKNNEAIGVKIKDIEQSYDLVISNILVQKLFKIADEKHFPKDYVNYINSLEGTGSLCAYYSFKKVPSYLIGKTFHFLERNVGIVGNDAVGIIDFMITSPEGGFSPVNECLAQAYIICTPDEAKNILVLKKLKQLLDKNLNVLIPEYQKQLKWAIYPAIWHLDGVAKTIDKDKPEIVTPIKNLYLVGDCVKAPGIGFNCAINSAKILTEMI